MREPRGGVTIARDPQDDGSAQLLQVVRRCRVTEYKGERGIGPW